MAEVAENRRDLVVSRCMAVVGTARLGPMYCGNRAKDHDANGRPICGVHKNGQPGILWLGDRGRYPEGTGGSWRFNLFSAEAERKGGQLGDQKEA